MGRRPRSRLHHAEEGHGQAERSAESPLLYKESVSQRSKGACVARGFSPPVFIMGRIVGIDLGTTNSLVAYLDPQTGQPKCIPGPYGSTLCPSVVSLDPDGSIVVGEPARRRLLTQPERTIYSVTRLIGRGPADGPHETQRGKVAVYDLGGGTFDISILKLISTSDGDIYQVLSTNGDTHLGGDDIDNLLQAFVHELILQHDEIDFSPHGELAQELRKALIDVKHQLSESETATLRFPLPNAKVFIHKFTRCALDALIRPVVDRTMGPVKQALADVQLKPTDLDE